MSHFNTLWDMSNRYPGCKGRIKFLVKSGADSKSLEDSPLVGHAIDYDAYRLTYKPCLNNHQAYTEYMDIARKALPPGYPIRSTWGGIPLSQEDSKVIEFLSIHSFRVFVSNEIDGQRGAAIKISHPYAGRYCTWIWRNLVAFDRPDRLNSEHVDIIHPWEFD